MKALLAVLALACVAVWTFAYIASNHHNSASLLPAQNIALTSARPVTLTLRADYPVTITGPGCSAVRTADARLSCGPGTIAIIDTRPALLVWSRANRVEWNAAAVW
jgi:hypothetical protein